MPNGMRRDILRGANSGRDPVMRTDEDLQTGPAPERIDRIFQDNAGGLIGDNVAVSVSAAGTGDLAYIPHTYTFRPQQQVRMAPRTYANDAVVPAVYAGNPLP